MSMKKAHTRSNLIAFCRGLMRLLHRNTSIFFVLYLLSLVLVATLLGLYFIQTSYVLGVQITVSKYRSHCETIHVTSVVAGHVSRLQYANMVKSILAKTQNPVHFHIITDRDSHQPLQTLFNTWYLPAVTASFYDIEPYLSWVDWIPNVHYSGIYGLAKLIIPEILPTNMKKTLVLDTDLLFLSDIVELWSQFNFMPPYECLGMTENLSGWYAQNITGPKWPALGNGFNSGLILINLERLAAQNFSAQWRETAKEHLRTTGRTLLADQDIFNSLIAKFPEMLYLLPSEYNVQLGMRSSFSEKLLQNARILHINNKKKTLEDYPKLDAILREIEDMDGSIFRQTRYACIQKSFSLQDGRRKECDEFRPLNVYRTHLFMLPYNHSAPAPVTLASQISADRLSMLNAQLHSWAGPVSVAVYGTDSEINYVLRFIAERYPDRRNVGLHAVYSQGNVYPINFLRNVAFNASSISYVLLLDGDFVFQQEGELVRSLSNLPQRSVFVIPAFEYESIQYETTQNRINKSELLKRIDEHKISPFRNTIWPRGHHATQFSVWRNATTSFKVEWETDFEPYIVGRKAELPHFDERFGGFGWNKAIHSFDLNVKGFQFLVHPDSFVVHIHHAPSNELVKYRSNAFYRKCMLRLKRDFVHDLLSTIAMINNE